MPERPAMYQTYTPFVEFFLGGVDLLRSSDGRPRELVSFTHTVSLYGKGSWVLEVFDPAYTEVEELIFDLARAREQEGDGAEKEITTGAMFKYGYVSQDGKVLSNPPSGEEYYVGTVARFTPEYQPHGTSYTIEGYSLRSGKMNYAVDKRTFYSASIYDIVKRVCDHQGWEFRPMLEPEEVEELPEDKRPELLLDTGQSVESTEEAPREFKMRPGEDPYAFIQRLCGYSRPQGPKYQGFSCRLEYRADGQRTEGGLRPGNVKGYLYFGPEDMMIRPERKYVYMRDPHSDVLAFAPTLLAQVVVSSGAAGVYTRNDDARHGEMAFHSYSEVDRKVKYFGHRRPTTGMTLAELGTLQEGEPEKEEEDGVIEGATTGPQQVAPQEKSDPDAPSVEHVSPVNNRFFADREYMNVWLSAHKYVNRATLQIFGDPYIQPPSLVAVYVFVPAENDEFRIHWTSSMWQVRGVVHQIASGMYTTSLDLVRNGSYGKGGTATKALYNTLIETMDEESLDRLGA